MTTQFAKLPTTPLSPTSIELIEAYITTPSFGDVDGDGDLDVAVGSNRDRIFYFENDGNGNFTERTGADNPFTRIVVEDTDPNPDPGDPVVQPGGGFASLADIDGDGLADLFVGGRFGNIYYYENTVTTGNPFFAATPTDSTLTALTNVLTGVTRITDTQAGMVPAGNPFNRPFDAPYAAPVFVDIDGDSDLDLFVGSIDGVKYFQNDGDVNTPTFVSSAPNPFAPFNSTLALLDTSPLSNKVNRVVPAFLPQLTGEFDAIVGQEDGTIRYFDNTAAPTAAPNFTELTGTANPFNDINTNNTLNGERAAIATFDVNNDGFFEVFTGSRTKTQADFQLLASGDTLFYDAGTETFTFGTTLNGSNLGIQVVSNQSVAITNVNFTDTTSGNQTELFSVLAQRFEPRGFSSSGLTYILQDVDTAVDEGVFTDANGVFQQGQQFQISFDLFASGVVSTLSPTSVTESSPGEWTLALDQDGNGSTDLEIKVFQTDELPNAGLGFTDSAGTNNTTQFNGGQEIIELATGAVGSFSLFREAQFNNFVGLYRIEDTAGRLASGLAPGDSGYAQEAIQNRVTGVNLQVGNQQTTTVSNISFEAGLYAPFIIVDGTVDEFLAGGRTAYFAYTEANSDGQDHILLLGNNVFGFEDLAGGGDFDYNDLIVQIEFTAAP
jgi:hypothetical protein